jgi:hypothetical protein
VVDIGLLVVEEVVRVHQDLMVVEVAGLLEFQDQIKAQVCPLPMYLHMSGLVQDQVFKTQVQLHHLPVLTLVQVVVVLVQVLIMRHIRVVMVVQVLSSLHILPKYIKQLIT